MFRAFWRGALYAPLGLFLFGFSLLVTVLVIRTYNLQNYQAVWQKQGVQEAKLGDSQIKQLRQALIGAVRIPTVSFSEETQNITALAEFKDYIKQVFPLVFSSSFIQHEIVAQYSHLFSIQGLDQSLVPYMMLAHLDVVPAPNEGWKFPPFSGEEHDGYIYGRGTLDDKSCVIGVLQALEFLLEKGYQPQRTFYIGLGHDEEVSGHDGAMKIVETLQSRGVKLVFVVDEGLAVLDGVIQGVKRPVALVGVTEKGAITLNLTVNQPPGHSSMPPAETSIGILAAAVSRLEKNQMPNMFGEGPEASMFQQLSGEFSFPLNIMMANLWLFSPIISRVLEKIPSSNALVRTTSALTIFHSGVKSNVIPHMATATVNFRLHPAQTVYERNGRRNLLVVTERPEKCSVPETPFFFSMVSDYPFCCFLSIWDWVLQSIPPLHTALGIIYLWASPAMGQQSHLVLDIVRNIINDERVKISVVNSFDPLPISPYDEANFGYQILQRTIHSVFSGVPVVPGICIGNTDSRHFVNLTNSIYRFSPFQLKSEDLGRIHGLNERISVENLKQLVQFYYQLIQNADSDKVPRTYKASHEL